MAQPPAGEHVQSLRVLWSAGCWSVLDVHNPTAHCNAWSDTQVNGTNGVALIRAGAYRRRVNGSAYVVNRAIGFSFNADAEVQSQHDVGADSRLTFIATPSSLGTEDAGPTPTLPLIVSAGLDLQHRLLHKDLDEGRESWEVGLRVAHLLAMALPALERPSAVRTEANRRELIDQVVDMLTRRRADAQLAEIARAVGYSPFHLSRVFKQATGMGLKEFRQNQRMMWVLDELEKGCDDLSAIAAEYGFADHGHMTRTLTRHLGSTPSCLREALGGTRRRRHTPVGSAAGA